MSQAGDIDVIGTHPEIPTEFVANVGVAVPIANVIELLGSVVAAGTNPFRSVASGNTVTYQAQLSQAFASSSAARVGLSSFDSSAFAVDANGFVTLTGGGGAISFIDVDAHTPPGTDPVIPNSGSITITGAQVASGVVGANVIRTNSLAANTLTIEIQRSTAVAATDSTKNGVSHFNSTEFSVDSSGFVSLIGGGIAVDSFAMQTGTTPVVPAGTGLVTFNGAIVAAGTNPVRTDGTGANTMALEVQISQALAATDSTKIGLCNFDSSRFSVDANGFVTINGAGVAETITGQSGGALSPTAGNWNIFGAVTAAGTSPVVTSGAVSTLTVNVQTSQALAAADATKIGLSNFDSSSFVVAATGFVTLSTTGVGKTITGNSGGALSPTAGNWNIVGTGSITAVGSGSTDTIQLTGLTNHAIQIGAGTATLTQLGAGTTGQILQTNTTADPTWSTATYPSTATGTGTILRADGTNWVATTSTYPNTNAASTLLYASSANVMAALATANSGVLTTSSSGVPSIDTTNFAVLSTGVQMKGNNTNTAPPAGFLGEQIRSYQSTPQALSSTATINVTSISLTAGIWDVSGIVTFAGTITGTIVRASISSTSATSSGSEGDSQVSMPTSPTVNANVNLSIPSVRVSLSGTTTYYLTATATYTVGTMNTIGRISATRVG